MGFTTRNSDLLRNGYKKANIILDFPYQNVLVEGYSRNWQGRGRLIQSDTVTPKNTINKLAIPIFKVRRPKSIYADESFKTNRTQT